MKIFDKNSEVLEINSSHKPLVLISASGEPSKRNTIGVRFMRGNYLINFDNSVAADYQLSKHSNGGYSYVTFGMSLIPITVSGIMSYHIKDTSGRTISVEDAESYFLDHNISSDDREIFRIVTSYATKANEVYSGYLVKFNKKPYNEERVFDGYAFSMTFLCWRGTDAK